LKDKVSRSKQEIKLVIGTKSIVQKTFEMVMFILCFNVQICVNFLQALTDFFIFHIYKFVLYFYLM